MALTLNGSDGEEVFSQLDPPHGRTQKGSRPLHICLHDFECGALQLCLCLQNFQELAWRKETGLDVL
jgi:hypothetical protein